MSFDQSEAPRHAAITFISSEVDNRRSVMRVWRKLLALCFAVWSSKRYFHFCLLFCFVQTTKSSSTWIKVIDYVLFIIFTFFGGFFSGGFLRFFCLYRCHPINEPSFYISLLALKLEFFFYNFNLSPALTCNFTAHWKTSVFILKKKVF